MDCLNILLLFDFGVFGFASDHVIEAVQNDRSRG
jgi:hypothetical protein